MHQSIPVRNKRWFTRSTWVLLIVGGLLGMPDLGVMGDGMPEAEAVIGAPWTPLSGGGVRRRTRRRTAVVVGTTAYAAGAASQKSAPPPAAVPAPPPPGTTIHALPGGCGPFTNGIYNCGGVYYRPYQSGNEVVYVVVPHP